MNEFTLIIKTLGCFQSRAGGLLAVFLLLSGSGWAQVRMSLAEALSLGAMYNSDLKAAGKREAIAISNRNVGVPDRRPTLDLSISQNNNLNQYDSPTSFVRGVYRDNSLNGNLSGSWLLYNGGRVTFSQFRLDRLAQQAELAAQATRQQVNRSVIAAYYRAVVEREKLRVRAEGVALSKARWTDFGSQERLGKASTFDVLQAENLFLTDSTTYLQQEIAVQTAQNELHLAIGWNRFEPVLLTDSLTPGPQPPAFANLSGKLLSQNPDLRSQRVGVQVATNDIRLQKTALQPTVRLNTSLNKSFTQTKFSDVPRIDGNYTNLLPAGLSITLPLSRGQETNRAIRQSKLEQSLSETLVSGNERRLLAQADLLDRSYQTQAKIVSLSALLTTNAARTLVIARNRLQNGFSNLIEYRAVQLAYTEAKLSQLQALYALKLIEADAKQLIGNLN